MCLAKPLKVLKIKNSKAIVEGDREVDISLISDLVEGDYILAHANLGINKLAKGEAEKILALIKNCHHNH